MDPIHPDKIFLPTRVWSIRHPIDSDRWRPVVFESDDWGSAESAPDIATAQRVAHAWNDYYQSDRAVLTTLESPADLERLFAALEKFHGVDGLPAVFTAFACVANPDFDAIRRANFSRYAWIGIDRGVPQGWERGAITAAWRAGITRGVFAPEFHSFLHHTCPKTWMQLLTTPGRDGDLARKLFDLNVFTQGRHIPEYEGLNVREQAIQVKAGIETFTRAVGYEPAAAVTSDAYPVTEVIWALCGIRTVCLKNCKDHNGAVVVYHTKPWNNQDPYVPMGAYSPLEDVVYLSRNAWLENEPADETGPIIQRLWAQGEPAVVSSHRIHYVSLRPENVDQGFARLEDLLGRLTAAGARFLTSAELGDLYRQGWSLRAVGPKQILRKWSEDSEPIRFPNNARHLIQRPDRHRFEIGANGAAKLPLGDYELE